MVALRPLRPLRPLNPRVILLLALLLAAALAGCAKPAAPPPAAPEQAPEPFYTMAAMPGAGLGGEPNLAVAPDGHTVYVVAPAYDDGSGGYGENRVWRGDTATGDWSYVGPVAKEWGTNDADIAVGPDGAVWVATMWARAGVADVTGAAKCTAVSRSTDAGATWTTNGLGCGESPFFDERPWMATDGGHAYLLHYQVAPLGAYEGPPALAASEDNARWDLLPAAAVPAGFVSPLVARDGALAFSNFAAGQRGYFGPSVWTSRDGGLTWAEQAVAKERNDLRHPGIALTDGAGLLTWVRLKPGDAGTEVRASRLDPATGSWGEPFTLGDGGTNAMAWANGSGGHLVVAWLHTDEAAHPCDVAGKAPWRLRVWQDGTVRDLPDVIHEGPLFTAIGSGDCFDDHGRGLGDYIAAAALPDGTAVIATPIDTGEGARPFAAPIHVFTVAPPAAASATPTSAS